MAKKASIGIIILSYIIFFIIWTIRVFFENPAEGNSNLWVTAIINAIIKIPVWTFAALYLIKRYRESLTISLNKMFKTRISLKILLPLIMILMVWSLAISYFTYGSIKIRPNFHFSELIGTVLIAGITEELLFRGAFLNIFQSITAPWKANVMTALLFALIHIPKWIFISHYAIQVILLTLIPIWVLGVIFGWSFQKSKSLWTPIVLHMVWNLSAILIAVK